MKRKNICIFLTLFSVFLWFAGGLDAKTVKTFTADVVKIIDGDSLKVRRGTLTYELRLYGIDAPEYDQPHANDAKRFVKRVLLGKNVEVIPVEIDKYNRLVAIVEIGGESINYKLLKQGLAWYYPKYCKKNICSLWQKVSKTAKKQKKNIWSDPSPIAPWKWKYYKHKSDRSDLSHQKLEILTAEIDIR